MNFPIPELCKFRHTPICTVCFPLRGNQINFSLSNHGILRNPLVWKTLWKLWITHRRISLLNLLCQSVSFDQTLPHRGGFCRERGYFDGFSQLPSCLLIFIFAVLPNHKSLSAHTFCRSSAKYTICIETVKALPISRQGFFNTVFQGRSSRSRGLKRAAGAVGDT